MTNNRSLIEFPVKEIEEASGANYLSHTSFLAGSIVVCGVIALVLLPEFIAFALLPLGLLWERARVAETILAKRLRQYQLDESVREAIAFGEIKEFAAGVDQEYREKKERLMAWVRQRPSLLERIFLSRRHRSQDDNKLLQNRLWELSYLDDCIRRARNS